MTNQPVLGHFARDVDENDIPSQIWRHNFGGIIKAPEYTAPLHQRKQDDQGPSMKCVFYATFEVIEAQVYWQTGRWLSVSDEEKERIIEIARLSGKFSPTQGALLTACLDVLAVSPVKLIDKEARNDEHVLVTVKPGDYWVCAKRSQSLDSYNNSIKLMVAKYGGVLWGINTGKSGLGYMEAGKTASGIIQENNNPIDFSHAIALTSYEKTLYALPGTYGEGFGNNGTVYLNEKYSKDLFTPIAFKITFL